MKTHLVLHCLCTALALSSDSSLAGAEGLKFALEQVANIGGRTAIGDIDGDGRNDIVVHTWSSRRGIDSDGSVSWYRFPEWKRTFILDGDIDILSARSWEDPPIQLYRNLTRPSSIK